MKTGTAFVASRLFTRERLTRFGWAMVLSVGLGCLIALIMADGSQTTGGGLLGGDWTAFRTAGLLLRDDPMLLLDFDAQTNAMAQWLDEGDLLPFPYPPIFALLYVPFSWLSFKAGYAIYLCMLVVLTAVGTKWTMDVLEVPRRWRAVGLLGSLTYAGPIFTYFAAQTSILTLVVLTWGSRSLVVDRSPFRTGAVFGLLWFKPQFAIPTLLLLAVAGHWRTALTAAGAVIPLWVVSAGVFGADWVQRWVTEILLVTEAGNRTSSTARTVSPVELVGGALEGPSGQILGLTLALVIGLGAAVLALRTTPRTLLPLICSALLLTAPHAFAYELTLLIPVIGAIAMDRRAVWPWPMATWLVGPLIVLPAPAILRVGYVVALTALWLCTSPVIDHVQGDDRGPRQAQLSR